MEDLLGLGGLDIGGGGNGASAGASSSGGGGGGLEDIFGTGSSGASGSATTTSRPVLLSGDCGFTMCGAFEKDSSTDAISLKLDFTNTSGAAHPGKFAFQFKKNLFALAPGSQGVSCGALQPGATASATLSVAISKKQYAVGGSDPLSIAVAVMNPAKPKGQNVSRSNIRAEFRERVHRKDERHELSGHVSRQRHPWRRRIARRPSEQSQALVPG